MSYAKFAESDLKQGMTACREVIENCHRILDAAAGNPDIKALGKVAKSTRKDTQRLERELAKLEKALAKSKRVSKR